MPFYLRTEFYIVAVYLLLMIGIGFYFVSRNRGGVDFFAGGRCIPWWVSGISLYMGNFSAWLFTGGAGFIYKTTGYGLVFFLLTGAVAYFLGSQLTAVHWRRSRVISPVEFTRRRFGPATQQMLGIITAVVFIAAAGNQLRAIATVVNSILGVDIVTAAVAIGIIVILYTLIGGLWAVMVTDVVQFVVLLGGTLLIAPLAVGLVDGGLTGVLGTLDFSIPPRYGDPSNNLHYLIAGLISFTLGAAGGQGPRFYCVPDERSARKVGMLAGVLFLTTPVLFSLPSLAARALWGGPDVLPNHISGDNPHEQVFVQMAMNVLPPGLVGVFLAAMFAATMSALDSVYNMVASVLSRDIFMHFKPDTSDRNLITIGRIMTLLCGIVTIVLCLFYIQSKQDLFKVMMEIVFISVTVMNAPMLMGLLFRSAPRSAGLACMIWALAAGIVIRVLLKWPGGPQTYLTWALSLGIFFVSPWLASLWRSRENRVATLVLGAVFSALVLGVMALGTPDAGHREWTIIAWYTAFMGVSFVVFAHWFSRPEDRTEVDEFYRNLDTPVDVRTEVAGSADAALSVFKLVGVLTLLIAGMVLVLMGIEALTDPALRSESWKYLTLTTILAVLGVLFWFAGRRSGPGSRETSNGTQA